MGFYVFLICLYCWELSFRCMLGNTTHLKNFNCMRKSSVFWKGGISILAVVFGAVYPGRCCDRIFTIALPGLQLVILMNVPLRLGPAQGRKPCKKKTSWFISCLEWYIHHNNRSEDDLYKFFSYSVWLN